MFLRLNARKARTGHQVFGLVGPAVDVTLKSPWRGLSLSQFSNKTDLQLVFGGGVEEGRFLVELRYHHGLRGVQRLDGGSPLFAYKSRAWILLAGVRLN